MTLGVGNFARMRTRVELVIRLGCRVSQMMSPGWSDVARPRRNVVLGASAVTDLALVAWLRRLDPDERAWGVRLAHLAIDVAANVALFDDRRPYVPALIPAFGPVLEAGYAGSPGATVAVPLTCLAGVVAGRAVRRRSPSPTSPVLLIGMIGAMAWGLRLYEAGQIRSARRAQQIDADAMAADARAEAHFWLYNTLDGSRLLDDLKNAINPLLGADSAAVVAVQAILQDQKEDALRPPQAAITLRRALEDAEASRYWDVTNRASTFRPRVDERTGATVLTPRQARQLLEWIEREFLTGRPDVHVVSGGHEIGSGMTLAVAGRRCRLPADQAPIELGPLGWLSAAAMVASTAAPWDRSVTPAVAATSAVLFLGSALASRTILHRKGRKGRGTAVVVGALPGLVHSLVGAAVMRDRPSPTGVALYPSIVPVMAIALEAGHHWDDLEPGAKLALGAVVGASVAPSWLFRDHDTISLLSALVWPVQHFTLTRELRRLVDDVTSVAAIEARETAVETVRRSRMIAVTEELRRLGRWVDDADRVLAAAVRADPALRSEAAARLKGVRALLGEIAVEAAATPG